MLCFTHCTDNGLKPTGPNKCLSTNLGVEVWVGSFKVGRIVEVFAVRVGVVFKVEDINDFFSMFCQRLLYGTGKGSSFCATFILCKLHILS